MRIFANPYELMSEVGRDLWEMGIETHPKTMQNKNVENNEMFKTKELICEQYCLMSLGTAQEEDMLFRYSDSKKWAQAELRERAIYIEGQPINPGTAYLQRADIWNNFLVDGKFDYTYNERIHFADMAKANDSNLYLVIDELKRNPDTRQGIIPLYHPTDVQFIGGKRRVPCSIYYNFLVRNDVNGNQVLHICYHQRSSDFVTHFGNDVWLAYKLMEFVANILGIKPGYLYHTIDSLHSYKKDWVQLKTSLSQAL